MTAEVALLNKTAVALAADSAMTLPSGKIYPAQKLFALTKHHPVGVMVYNNANFMGVPWETLIKIYRRALGKKSHPTVEKYLEDFLRFLTMPPFAMPEHELSNIVQIAQSLFIYIRRMATSAFQKDRRTSNRARNQILQVGMSGMLSQLEDKDDSPSMEGVNVRRIVSSCRQEVDACIDRVFLDSKITLANKRLMKRFVEQAIRTSASTNHRSGVVLAGFGEDEVFPTLFELSTLGVVGGKVNYDLLKHTDIARNGLPGMIIPFAQREMVNRFMEGIDPSLVQYLKDSMAETSLQLAIEILDSMNIQYSNAQKQGFRLVAEKQTENYLEEMRKFRQERFVQPIMEIVEQLPKEELADMAESLVSLTALKRRVSPELETVGGPIDVAVISKGDGLIWIRRKHYFDAALNQSHIARNYH